MIIPQYKNERDIREKKGSKMNKRILCIFVSLVLGMTLALPMAQAGDYEAGIATSNNQVVYANAYDNMWATAYVYTNTQEYNPVYIHVHMIVKETRTNPERLGYNYETTLRAMEESSNIYGTGYVERGETYYADRDACYLYIGMGTWQGKTYATSITMTAGMHSGSDTGDVTVKRVNDTREMYILGPIMNGEVEISDEILHINEMPVELQFTACQLWIQQNTAEYIDILSAYANGLPDHYFKGWPQRMVLDLHLQKASGMFEKGNDQAARAILGAVLSKVDGGPDDWMIPCVEQASLQSSIGLVLGLTNTPDCEAMLLAGCQHFGIA